MRGEGVNERHWKIGELAAATGLTVRTLRHFDQVGLLRPAGRTAAGHRRYTEGDVRRLYRILALRRLGLPLAAIGRALDGGPADLERAARTRLALADGQLDAVRQLRRRLRALLAAANHTQPTTRNQPHTATNHTAADHTVAGAGPADRTLDRLIEAMEAAMRESDFTPEQLVAARRQHAEPGFVDRLAGWRRRGAELAERLREQLAAGTDPADPAVQELAGRWADLMAEMAGGDRGMLSGIYARIDAKGPEAATRGVLTPDVWDYLRRAFAVGFR